MTSIGSADPVLANPPPPTKETLSVPGAQCATYTFPEGKTQAERLQRGHARSASHGGSAPISAASSTVSRPSALKSARGHQRAFSHGQISDTGSARPGHSRVGSKTDFILPPGHKETENVTTSRASAKGHSRQASRSESIYTLRRTAPPSLWRRLLCFVLRRSARNEQEDRKRVVVPNHIVPPKTPRKDHPNGRRPNNRVRTTKYTLLSFLPRNLLEQFHRVANLYFIFIVLLNWFPAINAFGKEISMIPVMFVLGVTAVKDLFEDRRRHASDKRINNTTCRIYQRKVDLVFSEEFTYKEASAYRFAMNRETLNLDNSDSCYCLNRTHGFNNPSGCVKNGLMELQNCYGAPILLSWPHFLWGEQEYLDEVEGMKPDEAKHLTYVELEPTTGTPFKGFKRIQMNMFLTPVEHYELFENVRDTIIPILWIEESVEISDDLYKTLDDAFLSKKSIIEIGKWVLIGVGVLIVILCTFVCFWKRG